MASARTSQPLALLLGFCTSFGFAPSAPAEPLARPIALGSIGAAAIAWGVSVVGTRAYVAEGVSGLRVFDSIAVPEPGALLLQIAPVSTLLGLRARRKPGA